MTDQSLQTQKFKAQLDEWKADLDKLKARAKGASADARIEMQKRIDALDARVAEAGTKLDELSAAGADAWDGLKKNVEHTWDGLKTSMHDAAARLKS